MKRKDRSIQRRKQILQTAESILSKKGLDTTISEIASQAGVPDSIIYHYFKNKEDLMFSVVGDSIGEAIDNLENELKGIREPMSQLSKHVWFQLNRIDREADFSQIVLFQCRSRHSYYDHPAFTVHTRRSFRLFYRIMGEGIERGDFREDLKIAIVLNMFHGLLDMENLMLRVSTEPNRIVDDFDGIMDLTEPILSPHSIAVEDRPDKSGRILEAAEKVFAEKGFDPSTIQDVVRKAEAAEGSVYWFYKSKEELLYSTLINGFRRSTDSFQSGDDPEESDSSAGANLSLAELERFLRDFYMIAVKQPPFSQVFVMNGIFNRQFYESRAYAPFKTFVDGISTRLDEGKAAGSIRAEVNNRLFRNLVLGTFCHSVVRWHVVEKESWHNIVNDIDLIVRYLLRTITIKNEKKKRKRRKKSK